MMEDEICKHHKGQLREKLINLWRMEIKREMDKSNEILQKKVQWLSEYESNYGKEPIKHKPNNRRKTNKTNGQQQQRSPSQSTGGGRRTYAEAVRQGPTQTVRDNIRPNKGQQQGPFRRRPPYGRRQGFRPRSGNFNREYDNFFQEQPRRRPFQWRRQGPRRRQNEELNTEFVNPFLAKRRRKTTRKK